MAKFKVLKKLAKYAAIGGFAGAVAGHTASPAGLRKHGRNEGFVSGALASAALSVAPRGIRKLGKMFAGKGSVIFRRIRGRIVPIRVKK